MLTAAVIGLVSAFPRLSTSCVFLAKLYLLRIKNAELSTSSRSLALLCILFFVPISQSLLHLLYPFHTSPPHPPHPCVLCNPQTSAFVLFYWPQDIRTHQVSLFSVVSTDALFLSCMLASHFTLIVACAATKPAFKGACEGNTCLPHFHLNSYDSDVICNLSRSFNSTSMVFTCVPLPFL